MRHLFWQAEHAGKVGLTAEVVARHDSAIVFCRTKHGADRLTRQLAQHGVPAVAIHGNRTQPQRHRALQRFASGEVRALVATDVAARGIHVDAVGCVVHFDPPNDEKDYLHRSGRTGRAGVDGTVVSLLMHDQVRLAQRFQRSLGLRQGIDRVDLGTLGAPLIATVARPVHAAAEAPERGERRNAGRPRQDGANRNRRGGQGRTRSDGAKRRDAGGDRRYSASTDRDNAATGRGEWKSDERRGEGSRSQRSGQPGGSHRARQTNRNRRRRYP